MIPATQSPEEWGNKDDIYNYPSLPEESDLSKDVIEYNYKIIDKKSKDEEKAKAVNHEAAADRLAAAAEVAKGSVSNYPALFGDVTPTKIKNSISELSRTQGTDSKIIFLKLIIIVQYNFINRNIINGGKNYKTIHG